MSNDTKDDEIRRRSGGAGATATPTRAVTYGLTDIQIFQLVSAGLLDYQTVIEEKGEKQAQAIMARQATKTDQNAIANLKRNAAAQPTPTTQGAPPPPAPVANAAASATAAGQAGGNAQFEGGDAERATGAATGAFGGTAQQGGAQALTAPQQAAGGGESAKPKPIRWSTSLNAWVRDTGRKDASGGNIVEIVDGPPSPEGSVAGGKRGDQRLVWDAVAKAYRQVEWDSGDQEWVWTDKLQNLPPIQRTAGGEALTTGRDVASGREATPEGQPITKVGQGAVAAPLEGLPTGPGGSGESSIFPVDPEFTPNIPAAYYGPYAPEVSTQGFPMSTDTGELGVQFVGQTAGGGGTAGLHSVSEFRSHAGGFAQDDVQLLRAFGRTVPSAPIAIPRAAMALRNDLANREAIGQNLAQAQESMTGRQLEWDEATGTYKYDRKQTREEARHQAALDTSLSGQDVPQEFGKGGKMTLPEPVFIIGRSGKVYATAGEKGGGTEDMQMFNESIKFIPNRMKRMQHGGEIDFDDPSRVAEAAGILGEVEARRTRTERRSDRAAFEENYGQLPPPPPWQEYVDYSGGLTVAEANRATAQAQQAAANQEREDRALADQLQEEINAAAEERQQGIQGYRYGLAGLPPPSALELPAEAQNLFDRRGRPLLNIPQGVRVRYESALAAARRRAQAQWQKMLAGQEVPALDQPVASPARSGADVGGRR